MIATMNKKTDSAIRRQELSNFVEALGGIVLPVGSYNKAIAVEVVLLDLRHMSPTAVEQGDAVDPLEAMNISNRGDFMNMLRDCKRRNIPIVEPSWLERVVGLRENEHWSEPSIIDNHIPAVLAMLDQPPPPQQQQHQRNLQDTITTTATSTIQAAAEAFTSCWRRDTSASMGQSISDTFNHLTQQHPDRMEEEAIRRAMELSMLDLALIFYRPSPFQRQPSDLHKNNKSSIKEPYDILGISKEASPTEIKTAYRKLARIHHPDKGGDSDTFEAIANAYRTMLQIGIDIDRDDDGPSTVRGLKSTSHWDAELQDHRRLVNDLFQAHGGNLDASVAKQFHVLEQLGLIAKDAGATNRNERDELIYNSCFYLSLASSYLRGITALVDDAATDDALIGQTALQLKRVIEAAVVKAHPEWAAQGMVGEEIQAFSDFLTYSLDDRASLLSDWAVVIFDSVSGFCDVYKGCNYSKLAAQATANQSATWARSNTITLLYTPGHYQPLLLVDQEARKRPTLEEILKILDAEDVFYVVTDGS